MKSIIKSLFQLCMLGLIVAATAPADAALKAWINGNGSWETPSKWSPATSPNSTDDIRIWANGTYVVNFNNTTADTGTSNTWMTVNELHVVGDGAGGMPTLLVDFTNTTQQLTINGTPSPITEAIRVYSGGRMILSNGTVWAAGGMTVGLSGISSGRLEVAGGSLQLNGLNVTQPGVVTISGGVITNRHASIFGINGGLLNIQGGTVAGNNLNIDSAVASATGRVYQTGGALNLAGTVTLASSFRGFYVQSNGTFTANAVNMADSPSARADWDIFGGTASIGAFKAAPYNDSTGRVTVADSGLLEFKSTITLGNPTTGLGSITNRDGGTVRFTVNNPTITKFGGSHFVTKDATIEFKDVSAADVSNTGNIATKITYSGANTLRLNSSTNAPIPSSTFHPGTNFTTLALINGETRWQSGVTTIGSGGSMLLSNTVATITGLTTNSGALRSVSSSGAFLGSLVNSGSIVMSAGDTFLFKSNFVNISTQNTTYDTEDGTFVFDGPGLTQSFYTAGHDLGPPTPGSGNTNNPVGGPAFGTGPSADNFALGTFEISNFRTVIVSDAFISPSGPAPDDGLRAALYVNDLIMGLNSLLIVSNNVSVYFYDTNTTTSANFNYVLLGDAELHQIIPEPSVLLLLCAGAGVVWRTRRGRARQI